MYFLCSVKEYSQIFQKYAYFLSHVGKTLNIEKNNVILFDPGPEPYIKSI